MTEALIIFLSHPVARIAEGLRHRLRVLDAHDRVMRPGCEEHRRIVGADHIDRLRALGIWRAAEGIAHLVILERIEIVGPGQRRNALDLHRHAGIAHE